MCIYMYSYIYIYIYIGPEGPKHLALLRATPRAEFDDIGARLC